MGKIIKYRARCGCCICIEDERWEHYGVSAGLLFERCSHGFVHIAKLSGEELALAFPLEKPDGPGIYPTIHTRLTDCRKAPDNDLLYVPKESINLLVNKGIVEPDILNYMKRNKKSD